MKTNTTHHNATKRPWHVQDEGSQVIIASLHDDDLPAIARIYDCENPGSKVNAALIVKAVNEYEALTQLESAILAFMPAFYELHPDAKALGGTEGIESALSTLNALRK